MARPAFLGRRLSPASAIKQEGRPVGAGLPARRGFDDRRPRPAGQAVASPCPRPGAGQFERSPAGAIHYVAEQPPDLDPHR
jgi:hypothetical protein